MTTIERIKVLAEAATPGPWYDAGCWTVHGSDHNEIAHPTNFEDIAYVAALDPQTILRLLAVIAAAELVRRRWGKYDMIAEHDLDAMDAYDAAVDALEYKK